MCALSCRSVCTVSWETTKILRMKLHKEDPSGVIKDVGSMFFGMLLCDVHLTG